MKKLFILLQILLFTQVTNAQNVGIGTNTPTTRLEIKTPQKSTVKISSNNFIDTSQLIFSNRNTANQGTDILLTSNRETGLRISSSSDLTANNKDTIMQITPTGFVGIRTAAPQYPLDVKGDMNVTGELKTNGSGGSAGNVLRSNGNGTMSWAGKETFENFRVYRNQGSTNTIQSFIFSLPAGVTKIGVEIWGGGGRSNVISSAGSGGYIFAIIPTTILGTININVGAGAGCFVCLSGTGTLDYIGNTSSVTIGSSAQLLLNVEGGTIMSSPAISQGGFSASGSAVGSISYYGIEGSGGKFAEREYQNSPTGYFLFLKNANGGDAPTRPATGGKSGSLQYNSTGTTIIVNSEGGRGSEPGGGAAFPNASGGDGQVIVYW